MINIKNISIKWQLLVVCITLVLIPVLILGTFSYNTAKVKIEDEIENTLQQQALTMYETTTGVYNTALNKVKTDLGAAEMMILIGINTPRRIALDYNNMIDFDAVNQITKQTTTVNIPQLTINEETVVYDTHYVDKIEESLGVTATIFQLIPQGLLRVSTNVRKLDGNRAVGTYIPTDSIVYQTIMRGETYYGRAFVVNAWYLTAYKPIRDINNDIVGVLYVGIKEDGFQDIIKEKLANLKFGKTGYAYILDDEGNYVLSLNRQRDGENIWESKDSDGNLFIQDIVNTANNLKERESAVTYYPWKNNGEKSARMKLAGYTYFSDWGWTIAASAYQEDFLDSLKAIKTTAITISIIAILLGSLIAYMFAIMISKPLNHAKRIIARVAEGNLDERIDMKSNILEVNQLSESFDKMASKVSDTIKKVIENTNTAAASAEELSASAEEVNASVEQVSSTVQEIAKGAQTLSKNAGDASTKSKLTSESSSKGAKSAQEVKEKMTQISETTTTGAQKVKALGEKSQKIGEIIETINNISEQTNLLALNAAIEAARAGEAGRGFAVVADEVRKLAEESQKATAQISELIGGIQTEIGSSVESMDENTKQVEEGSKSVNAALASFEEIPALVNQVNSAISEVSAIAEENAAGAQEVSASVEQVTSAIQQVASSSEKLASGANQLKEIVSFFKVKQYQEQQKEKKEL